MIVTRTPLRISFVGGGSDLPAYFRDEPGYVVSTAIDKYVYIAVNRKFDDSIRVAYSQTENVRDIYDLQHRLVAESLGRLGIRSHIEIHSIADIPAGTGLGSSSGFTVGLLTALHAYQGRYRTPEELASEAVAIELEHCHSPIGLQDQYIAAYGGLRTFTFTERRVEVEQLDLDDELVRTLNNHLLLLDTGLPPRDANGILREQARMDDTMRTKIHTLVRAAYEFAAALKEGDITACGLVLDVAWQIKRCLTNSVSSAQIDGWYEAARRAGAWGGKLCGAGKSGFLVFLAPPDRHEAIVRVTGLRAVSVRIGVPGAAVVYA